ncbi:MAG: peptidoglycan DD-metalloendopeptidase family protein [Candidatus Cloacimonetes bacterium]|nr:peptidoglycan DD-metalloendopeptidase family protein [Candidatus Cloacimonadota bacterium]
MKYFYGIGESLDRTMAENQALANAMRELGMYVENHTISSIRSLSVLQESSDIESYYFDEIVSRINISASNSIRNSRVSRNETFRNSEGIYRTYIQVVFDDRLFQDMIYEYDPETQNRSGVLNTPNYRIYMKKSIFVILFYITLLYAQVFEPVFHPEWWHSSPTEEDIFFYGFGESSDRELAEEVARAEAYDRLVMFINGFINAWWENPESFISDQNSVSQSRMSEQYIEILGSATIRGSHFSRRETYQLENGVYEAFFQLSLAQEILNEIMSEAVIEVEDLRRQEITQDIRNAIREMIDQAVEIALLDYEEEVLSVVSIVPVDDVEPESTPQIEPVIPPVQTPEVPIQPSPPPNIQPIVPIDPSSTQYKAPLDRLVVSSPFGMRMHPIRKVMLNHNGIDFRASLGTPVYAISGGVVFNARNESQGYGLVVRIRHDNGNVSLYAHLSRMNVRNGERVNQGDVVGLVGSTGASTGPHLHFGYRIDNVWVDLLDKIQ